MYTSIEHVRSTSIAVLILMWFWYIYFLNPSHLLINLSYIKFSKGLVTTERLRERIHTLYIKIHVFCRERLFIHYRQLLYTITFCYIVTILNYSIKAILLLLHEFVYSNICLVRFKLYMFFVTREVALWYRYLNICTSKCANKSKRIELYSATWQSKFHSSNKNTTVKFHHSWVFHLFNKVRYVMQLNCIVVLHCVNLHPFVYTFFFNDGLLFWLDP